MGYRYRVRHRRRSRGGHRVEITTFRADSYDQVSRNPQVRFGDRLEDDLVRRDFTVNAMAVRITAAGPGEFLDPLDGLAALRDNVLDTPAAPEVSFGDDPLRMLRAARFVSQLGFTVAPRVRTAMREMAPQLARITAERVAAELDKLLLGADPVAGIDADGGDRAGGAGAARDRRDAAGDRRAPPAQGRLPAFADRSATRPIDSGGDEGPDLVLRWAALLHDIGKPATRRHEPDGGVSFHHHEVVGAKMARKRMRALKYSKQMVDDVSQLVFLHLRFHGYGDGRVDGLGRAPLRHRRRPAAAAAAQAGPRRLHHPQQAPGGAVAGHLRRLGGPDRRALRAGGPGAGPAGPRRQRDHAVAGHPCRPRSRGGVALLKELRLDRGPLTHDEARDELLAWWAQRRH